MHTWNKDKPLHLIESQADKEDKEAKALACYGVWFPQCKKMHLRFAEGRPISKLTCKFMQWICEELGKKNKRVWAVVWDNASWHISQQVQEWIRQHNEQAKQAGGVRIIVCALPIKSPWLNPIEPKWLHGKRAIVEPEGKLTASEIMERVHLYYDCQQLMPIAK